MFTLRNSSATFPYYRQCALELLVWKAAHWPNAAFLVHMDEGAARSEGTLAAMHAAARGRARFVVYAFSRRVQPWIVNAMRLAALWEQKWARGRTVVVLDVHDEQRYQDEQLLGALKQLEREGKQIALTYWASSHSAANCACSAPLATPRAGTTASSWPRTWPRR